MKTDTKTINLKEPIRIRFKELKNGCKSIYLDCYMGRGRRAYRFLNIYLRPENTVEDRKWNKEQMRMANVIKSQQIIELQNRRFGLCCNSHAAQDNFIDYCTEIYKTYMAKGQKTCATLQKYAIERLVSYRGKDVRFSQIDKEYIGGFIEHLDNESYIWDKHCTGNRSRGISDEYKTALFARVMTSLNKAERDGLIPRNPGKDIDRRQKPRSRPKSRCYLTLDEVRKIIDTPYSPNNDIKRAFLFCCFCGLRYSDVRNLRWRNLKTAPDGKIQIEIKMQKTGHDLYLPLSANALTWLPPHESRSPDSLIFCHLPVQVSNADCRLATLIRKAGIDKHVTFHVARHTFATLTLSYGADLYTVSKLLGHTKVQTTQIYAKIVDESKRKAVDLIPTI